MMTRQFLQANSKFIVRLTTENDSCLLVQSCQSEVQDITTNIVEEHVEVADMLFEIIEEALALVVDSLVDA